MSEQTIRVLLLDDEESLRKHLSTYLHDNYDLTVDAVANGNKALDLIEEAQGHYDVALLDEALPEGPSGLEVLRAIKVKYPDIEAILFTGWGRQAGMEALRAGAYRFHACLPSPAREEDSLNVWILDFNCPQDFESAGTFRQRFV